ncbi:MAG: trimethylamine methyltransferase family protein [Deltaproteobacteria bacterium]|jgi:trimethylamine--corrinoid protein Co-methyltransferase|nr:trimethylamine methyltransferase family protein [Deltaproteobacteria bacterium]
MFGEKELIFKPELKVLSLEQIRRIHWASLEVMERTGLIMNHAKALEALSGAGCRVDKIGEGKGRVRFPAWLVEECLRRAPKRVVLGDRSGERKLALQGANTFFGPSLDCINYLDPATGEKVPFTLEHCVATARLSDALPNFQWSMIIGMASDQSPELADRLVAKTVLENSEQPLVFCCNNGESLKAIYEMALVIAGSREDFEKAPFLVHYSEPISPLTYYGPSLEKIIFCSEKRVPLIILSAPLSGGTGPSSLVGAVVLGNAESLSGLVLSQVLAPGAPFIYGIQASIMDMRTTIYSYGAPEAALMNCASVGLAQFYDLPQFSTAGATDSRYLDAQAGLESAFQCLSAGACGGGLIHDCGSWMYHGSVASPEFMVLNNEILYLVNHFMNGLKVSDETLSVEAINEVGPGGHYLQHPSTRRYFKEVFYSKLFDRTMAEKPDSPKFGERLRELTLEKMRYQPKSLSQEKTQELARMVESWRRASN